MFYYGPLVDPKSFLDQSNLFEPYQKILLMDQKAKLEIRKKESVHIKKFCVN